MSYTSTTRLGLKKAVPGSAQPFETTVFNSNWDALDAEATAADGRLDVLEAINASGRLNAVEATNTTQDTRLTAIETLNTTQDSRLTAVEGINTTQNTRLTTLEGRSGRNFILNSAFDVWQRGVTFSNPATLTYLADRWQLSFDGSGATRNITQQTFTPGTAPVAGYEGSYYLQLAQTVAGTGGTSNLIQQKIEGVRTLANQAITISFWVNVAQATAVNVSATQNFGTGGSTAVTTSGTSQNITTTGTWQRISFSLTVPSIAGKTIGTANDNLAIAILLPVNATQTVNIWGVQVESGSTVSSFARSEIGIATETARCQRYYYRVISQGAYDSFGPGFAYLTTNALFTVPFPVTMRTVPTIDNSSASAFRVTDGNTSTAATGIGQQNGTATFAGVSNQGSVINVTVASGLTQYRPYFLGANNAAGTYLGFSAEL